MLTTQEILDKYDKLIYYFIHRYAKSVYNYWEDIAQDARLALIEASSRFDSEVGEADRYYKKVVEYSVLRSSLRYARQDRPIIDVDVSEMASKVDIQQDVINNDVLMNIMEDLPTIDKEIFFNYYVNGNTLEELADKYSVSKQAIHKKLKKIVDIWEINQKVVDK